MRQLSNNLFGLELEFTTDINCDRVGVLVNRDLRLKNGELYTCYDGGGVEIKTAPITHKKWDLIERLMEWVREKDMRATWQDGFHVHHSAKWATMDQIRVWGTLWYTFEPLMLALVDRSRAQNEFCRPLRARCPSLDHFKMLISGETNRDYKYMYPFFEDLGRAALVPHSHRHPTTEVRLHQGTLDFKAVKFWTLFTQSMFLASAQFPNINDPYFSDRVESTKEQLAPDALKLIEPLLPDAELQFVSDTIAQRAFLSN